MYSCGQLPAAGCMRHVQQRQQHAPLQQCRQHLSIGLRRSRSRRSRTPHSTQAVQTAERPAAAFPGGTWPSTQERITAFDGRGIAVEAPPLTDIQLPTLRDSHHKVLERLPPSSCCANPACDYSMLRRQRTASQFRWHDV